MADVNLASSSDVVIESRESIETGNEAFEPAFKKQRKEESNAEKTKNADERLETRLGGILCCSVCLDLPSSAVYQVSFFLDKVVLNLLSIWLPVLDVIKLPLLILYFLMIPNMCNCNSKAVILFQTFLCLVCLPTGSDFAIVLSPIFLGLGLSWA